MLKALTDKINAYEQKTRFVILSVVCLLLVLAWNRFWVMPLEAELRRNQQSVEDAKTAIQEAKVKKKEHENALESDPNAANQRLIEQLGGTLEEIDRKIKMESSVLMHPQEMLLAMKRLVAHRPAVELVRLNALPPVEINLSPPVTAGDPQGRAAKDRPSVVLYQHGLELVFKASYLDSVTLLEEVEQYPWGLFWSDVAFETTGGADPVATIKLFTLTLGKELIGG